MKKRVLIILLLIVSIFIPTFKAETIESSIKKLEDLNITYDREFRGVWISTLTSDISPYSTEAGFKSNMNEVFKIMEHFKLNAMIFHIRTHNNALYKSKLNPVAGWWRTVDFDKFDPLEWLIAECHKRGMEFHAWMNPYRLGNSHYYGEPLPSVNAANDSSNIIGSILNPGLPNVREFLIATVMEVLENYDVDAIHFDDYFYTNLGANGELTGDKTILDEPDQATFIKYAGNYNTNSAVDKAKWRRDQVNLFIEGLSKEIRKFNKENNKYVQLGISPTGIYRNGNGVVTYDSNGLPITSGSKTSGQEHYNSYLFADSLKWAVEGWVDYLLPQSYWATNHPAGPYYEVIGWWNKVIKNLNCRLYSGIGIYQANENDRFGWNSDPEQLYKQLSHVEGLENISGVSFYSYKHLRDAYKSVSQTSTEQLACIGNTIWNNKKLLPVLKGVEEIEAGKVSNFTVKGNKLTWDRVDDAKFYIIFRDEEQIDFSNEQIYAVVGGDEDIITYVDTTSGDYVYGIKTMSYTNTIGEGALPTVLPVDPVFKINFYIENTLVASFNSDEEFNLPNIPTKVGYDKVAPVWSITNFENITEDVNVYAIYIINTYEVKFYDLFNRLISSKIVEHGKSVIAPEELEVEGYTFKEWDKDFSDVQSDLNVFAIYEKNKYTVKFYGYDGVLLKEEIVEYGNSATEPSLEEIEGYEFREWDKDFSNIKDNLEVKAIYEKIDNGKNPEDLFSCKKISYSLFVFIKSKE
jgi:uncharacterized lipoprotein YddW (UPF0748 family)